MSNKTMYISILLLLFLLVGCSDSKGAVKALDEQGYTNIHIEGYSWYGCGKGDDFATKFSATSLSGKRVEGVVCSGWLKGSTIRTF